MIDTENKYYKMMSDEIRTITNEDIKEFADKLLLDIPEYFFFVPASSSGRYHPVDELSEGGLVIHSIKVKKMLDHLLDLELYTEITERQKDLLRFAALFHDCMKSGTQDDYELNRHTKLLHPVYSASHILLKSAELYFPYDDAKYIADAVVAHMGKWCESKFEQGKLPVPETQEQKILHLADYLASRKNINIKID